MRNRRTTLLLTAALLLGAGATAHLDPARAATATVTGVIGQPDTASGELETRCTKRQARFNDSIDNPIGEYQQGPVGIVSLGDGLVAVGDNGGHRVLIFSNPTSGQVCPVAVGVVKGIVSVEALAFDPATRTLAVADAIADRVKTFVIAPDGTSATKLGTFGKGNRAKGTNDLNFPRGLAFDATGRLWIADDHNQRILVFAPPGPGAVAASAATTVLDGAADGGYTRVPSLFIDQRGRPFVGDLGGRILRYDSLASAEAGDAAAAVFSTEGSVPVDFTVAANRIIVGDITGPVVGVYKKASGPGTTAGYDTTFGSGVIANPLGMAVVDGKLLVAEYEKYRVLVVTIGF